MNGWPWIQVAGDPKRGWVRGICGRWSGIPPGAGAPPSMGRQERTPKLRVAAWQLGGGSSLLPRAPTAPRP